MRCSACSTDNPDDKASAAIADSVWCRFAHNAAQPAAQRSATANLRRSLSGLVDSPTIVVLHRSRNPAVLRPRMIADDATILRLLGEAAQSSVSRP